MRISDWSSDVCSSDLLTVTEAAPPARAGSAAFIETQIDDEDPYVQQSVGYTLRLYYATPLVSGQLDQATPDGASLQRVGSDLQYTRLVGGKRYRSEEHTSELQSLMRISYAVFCLKKKKQPADRNRN